MGTNVVAKKSANDPHVGCQYCQFVARIDIKRWTAGSNCRGGQTLVDRQWPTGAPSAHDLDVRCDFVRIVIQAIELGLQSAPDLSSAPDFVHLLGRLMKLVAGRPTALRRHVCATQPVVKHIHSGHEYRILTCICGTSRVPNQMIFRSLAVTIS